LRGEIRPSAALPSFGSDPVLQRLEATTDEITIRFQAEQLALICPLRRRPMASLAVAANACGDLVLDPGGTALDPGDEMIGRRPDEPTEQSPAPCAHRAVSLEDELEPLPTVG
jgi:hypothetical protein